MCSSAFSCYDFTGTDGWLIADVAIACDSDKHHAVKQLAWTAVMLYPIGLLVLNSTLLFRARRAIASRQLTPLSHALEFLWREYAPQYWFWGPCWPISAVLMCPFPVVAP